MKGKQNMGKKKDNKTNKKASFLTWGITAVILSKIFGFGLGGIIAGVAIGFGLGKVVGIMATPLDTTTHNKGDDERRALEELRRQQEAETARLAEEARRKAEEAQRIPRSGNPTADAIIDAGEKMLQTIRAENDAIPDQMLSDQMEDLTTRCEQILRTLAESPEKASQVRKFMNYYLPTTLKMLANYRTMQNRGVSVREMTEARSTTIRGMNMILTACQKQIDNLHRENMLDISTDIDVLEQMLKRDGYLEDELTGEKGISQARTATQAQMQAGTPVMDFSSIHEDSPYLKDYFDHKSS